MRYKLKNTKSRRKAPFGSEEAATLSAAAISAGATMAAAGLGVKATKDAAKEQAASINAQSLRQANAIAEVNRKNKELQEENQEFLKEENAENRALQRDLQMQLQMLAGQQNENDRLEASKLKVKCGGRLKRLSGGTDNRLSSVSLRGANNLPFKVTDGGKVVHLGTTNNGNDLYELYGNDHEHYHKTPSGKNKTGVGIKFADGNVVEGEGNQNSSNGEKMLVTPNNAYFISKHTIKGFNPANAVDNGMDPMTAFNVQETIKSLYGIKDDGTKAAYGKKLNGIIIPNDNNSFSSPESLSSLTGSRYSNPDASNKNSGWGSFGSNLVGAGISTLGNIGGAIISTIGTRNAAKILANAYSDAGNNLANAYRNLRTIDTNILDRSDFTSARAMPAIQSPVSFAQNKITEVNRQLQRRLANAKNYSLSNAAMQDRSRLAEIDSQDLRNKIYSDDEKQMQDIRQKNADRISQAALVNAQLATQANKDYSENKLKLAMYNNEIENDRITKPVEALADARIQAADALSKAGTANSQTWANAVDKSASAFANTLSDYGRLKFEYDNELSGADFDAKVSTVLMRGDRRNARRLYDDIKVQLLKENISDKVREKLELQKSRLEEQFDFE